MKVQEIIRAARIYVPYRLTVGSANAGFLRTSLRGMLTTLGLHGQKFVKNISGRLTNLIAMTAGWFVNAGEDAGSGRDNTKGYSHPTLFYAMPMGLLNFSDCLTHRINREQVLPVQSPGTSFWFS